MLKKIIFLFCFCFLGCESTKYYGVVNEDIHPKMPEYFSDYVPVMAENLPVVKITSESGNNDFISLPVDWDITLAKRKWGDFRDIPAPWYENCNITIIDENNNLNLESVEAKVKVRGNWTSNYPKKPLRIKFDKKQSVLGMNNSAKNKNWVLLASYKDWSFLRDQTAYYLGHLISPLYTTDFRLVELYVNNQYQGVYVLAEKQDVVKNRIDLTVPKKDYKEFDIGYLIELDDHTKSDENNFLMKFTKPLYGKDNMPVSHFVDIYSLKSDISCNEQLDFIANYLNNLWVLCYEAVYNGIYYKFDESLTQLIPSDAESCYECITKVINLESLVDAYIFHEIVCDADVYLTSFYMDVDFGENGSGKLTFEAPWDFDSALGNKNFCADSEGLYAGVNGWDVDHKNRGYGNPWFLIFINCSWFDEMVRQKWTMMKEQKIIDKLVEFIDFESSTYEKNFNANYSLWKNCGNPATIGELCYRAGACKNEKEAAEYLKTWLVARFESLDSIWLGE